MPGHTVAVSGGPRFFVKEGSPGYRELLGMATSALMTASTFTVRFNADNVDCKSAAMRSDLTALILSNETPTTVPVSDRPSR